MEVRQVGVALAELGDEVCVGRLRVIKLEVHVCKDG
jgi:hypothetical protein